MSDMPDELNILKAEDGYYYVAEQIIGKYDSTHYTRTEAIDTSARLRALIDDNVRERDLEIARLRRKMFDARERLFRAKAMSAIAHIYDEIDEALRLLESEGR